MLALPTTQSAGTCCWSTLPSAVLNTAVSMSSPSFSPLTGASAGTPSSRTVLLTEMPLAELVALRSQDVNHEAATLQVEKDCRARERRPLRGQAPETWRPPSVYLCPDLVALLRLHRAAQTMEQRRVGGAWADHGLVFRSSVRTPLVASRVRAEMARIAAAAGVPMIRVHYCPHIAATLMLVVNREAVHVISRRLGHASVLITLAVYGHLLPGMQAQPPPRSSASSATPGE